VADVTNPTLQKSKVTIADVPIMKKKRNNSQKTFNALAALPKTGTKNFKKI